LLLGELVTLESEKSYSLSVRKIPAKDALLVLENVPTKATVELDGENVPVAPTAGQPLKIAAYPGRHVVIVKLGRDVLLAESLSLQSGGEVKRSVALKEPVVTPAPSTNPGPERVTRTPSLEVPVPSEPLPAQWTSPSTGMTLIRIKGGEFMMGSPDDDTKAQRDEKPQHKVRISPFYLGVTEVTQKQYVQVMGNNTSYFSPEGRGKGRVARQSTDQFPVESVSWLDAIRFCNGLSKKDGQSAYYEIAGDDVRIPNPKGSGYRLPTEAEWEYACRAGAATKYSFGDDPSELGDSAWYSGNASNTTHPVGQKRPNAFGLYDMHGNVWEWCWDWYSDSYYKEPVVDDPLGPSGASHRVVRGGSWLFVARHVRAAYRIRLQPSLRNPDLGFRLAAVQSGR